MIHVTLSIVVPLYNEEENVRPLHAAVVGALENTPLSYELVLVDDGSVDATFAVAADLVDRDPRVRVIAFRRNYGQTAATAAGIQHARGQIIVTMDGDLQNDPADIPRMVALLESGYHIVVGWRRRRRDEAKRVFISKVANRLIAWILGAAVRDTGCSLRAYRAELIQGLPLYSEMHRFIPALSQLAGARLAQIEVNHRPRQFGVSKYGFTRIYKVLLDLISIRVLLSYARRPFLWHWMITASVSAAGLALVMFSMLFPVDGGMIVEASIGILLISLGLFFVFWSILGKLISLHERSIDRFASLAVSLSAQIGSPHHSEGRA